MRITSSRWLLLAATAALCAGCASYRTESNVPAPSAVSPGQPTPAAASSTSQVLITEDALSNRKMRQLGPIEVSVKKLTVFHKDPTRDQADEALRERARALGADAVIRVTYSSGIGFTTWGYIDAKGTAVKLLD